MAEYNLLAARTSFDVALPGGHSVTVSAGDLFDVGDPIVKGREAMFGPPNVRTSEPPAPLLVAPSATATADPAGETADAAPGGRRVLPGKHAARGARATTKEVTP